MKDKINGLKSMIMIKIYYLFGFESFNKKYIEYLEKDYNNFRYCLSYKFYNQDFLLTKFENVLNSLVFKKLEHNLFGIFISNNIEELTKDFNFHMKNHNVELIFIKIIKDRKEILL